LKRIVKAILKKMLSPVLSRWHLLLNKIDKSSMHIMNVLSICSPITEYPPAHGTLRKIQLAKTNVLFAFDLFCKENELRYWIYSGTHLGAVRHGGFIPWDDDIDVAMMREDFDRLIKIVGSMPQNRKIQYHWCAGFLKIKYIENDFMLDAMDIFPFHQYYKRTSTVEGNQLKKLIDKRVDLTYYKVPLSEMPYCGTPSEIKTMREIIMEGKDATEDGDIFAVNCNKCIFRYEWIFPLKTMSFEGRELPVPNNSDNVLESQYGDFMMYPLDMSGGHGSISDDLRDNWRNYEKLDAFLSMDSDAIYKLMTEVEEMNLREMMQKDCHCLASLE
jgi:lipopolysaccharide cholinephosphotransferase